jgi:hypothetical protein
MIISFANMEPPQASVQDILKMIEYTSRACYIWDVACQDYQNKHLKVKQ